MSGGVAAGLGLSPAALAALLAAAAALLVAAGVSLARLSLREGRVVARLAALRGGAAARPAQGGARAGAARALASLGHWLARSGLFSPRTMGELERTVASAGLRGGNAVALFVGAKVAGLPLGTALGAALALLAGLGGATAFAVVAGGAVVGLLLPDAAARRFRRRHLAALDRGLPDALDLLVICAEAGMSLEGAVARVADEMRFANPSVAAELALCAKELQLLADRRQALVNLGERTGLDQLKRVAGALSQALRYGTPITQALRTLAAELRDEQANRFEARAARLPSMLTVPMILCILPTLFLVVGGPALLRALALR